VLLAADRQEVASLNTESLNQLFKTLEQWNDYLERYCARTSTACRRNTEATPDSHTSGEPAAELVPGVEAGQTPITVNQQYRNITILSSYRPRKVARPTGDFHPIASNNYLER